MKLHYSMAPHGSASKPDLAEQQKLRRDAEAAFAVMRADMEEARPDVLIVIANDQFVNFFSNNIPTFFVTLADEVKGQFTRHKFHYKNDKELGREIVRAGMDAGIDLSFGEHVELQHTQLVPLYFIHREAKIPILPVFVNTWVDPAPTPRRCYQLGQLIRSVADASRRRIALLATGGLSHYPGSPRIGQIDAEFDHKLLDILRAGRGRTLTECSVDELLEAGDTEFLNWMVVVGAIGDARASYTSYMPDKVATGWGFASWKL
jgi:aromatic ring-opening dioxygenase catalytic subunit (LigB family)